MAALAAAQDQQEQYVGSVAGAAASPVAKITSARGPLDAEAITDAEFRGLKVTALA